MLFFQKGIYATNLGNIETVLLGNPNVIRNDIRVLHEGVEISPKNLKIPSAKAPGKD